MNSDRKVVLDTETTGLSVEEGDRVIEIGMVELDHGVRTGKEFHHYLNPGDRLISTASENVHGLTNQFLKDKPTFKQVVQEFVDFVNGAELVIHNAEFDLGFLNAELERVGVRQKLEELCHVIDTLVIARKRFRGARANLNALCNRFGIRYVESREKHGALLDAQLLADVYIAMQHGADLELQEIQSEEFGDGMVTDFSTIERNPTIIQATDEELDLHQQILDGLGTASDN
ncbi:MAG: DNA polymerase III subunit epsilon [Gammaproteobacteria bacterium]|nr:DNA polymerase III subunit epsilon [Gammaproteobacteria bacterium]